MRKLFSYFLYVSYVKLIFPLSSPPPSWFLNLRYDEPTNVRVNLAHQGKEGDGEGNGGLFNVNPQVTEALNEVTHIYSELDNINDLSQNGPPHFNYTPQQVRRSYLAQCVPSMHLHPHLLVFMHFWPSLYSYYLCINSIFMHQNVPIVHSMLSLQFSVSIFGTTY